MATSLRANIEYLCGDQPATFQATTRHIAGIFPSHAENGLIDPSTGLKVPGIPIGYCGINDSGGMLDFDEYQLYQAGLLTNANVILLGKIGMGKSGWVKCYIWRSAALGYNTLVTDRKGEYTELARSIPGSSILEF